MIIKQLEKELKHPEGVTRLKLNSADLTDLPDELGLFVNLEFLELSFNCLEKLPDGVTRLSKLKKLHLRKNKLVALSDHMANMKSLRMIHMPGNPGLNSSKTFKQLSQLPKLEKLCMGDCAIESIDPSIGRFPSIRVLHLYDNLISSLPYEIFGLKKLQILDLKGNPIDRKDMDGTFLSKVVRVEL